MFDAWPKVATQKMCHPMPNRFNMVAEHGLEQEHKETPQPQERIPQRTESSWMSLCRQRPETVRLFSRASDLGADR